MAMIRKAERRKAKGRVGISGPAGAGKTMGALLMAYGVTGDWDKICLIDTENGSGELYANYAKGGIEIGEYNVITLTSPYSPDKYIAAIKECENAGMEAIVIDSLTHAWSGEGGVLDKKGQVERSGKPGVNSWTAWRDVTPLHNRLVEAILTSTCHIFATLRAKMDYVQEQGPDGKSVIRKVGLNPIQRDGMEYEFTVFIDVAQDHQATSSKDRTSLFDGRVFTLNVEAGRLLKKWLEAGKDAPEPPKQQPAQQPTQDGLQQNPPPQQQKGKGVTQPQITRMFAIAKSANTPNEAIKAFMMEYYKIDSTKALTKEQYDSLCAAIEDGTVKAWYEAKETEGK